MIDDATLAKLEAVEKEATPRPWAYDGQHNEITTPTTDADQYWLIVSECRSAPDQTAEQDRFGHQYDANYDLIVRGRNAMPDLLATIRALKAALEQIVSLHLDRHDYPEYDITLSTEVPRKEWGQGVADGRREAAEIAQAALRGEEVPDASA